MKRLVPLLLIFAGCQSRPTLPPPTPAAPTVTVPPIPTQTDWEKRLRQERQLAEAVLSQNEALQAELHQMQIPPQETPPKPKTEPAPPSPAPATPPVQVTVKEPPGPVFTPNAEGLIDLTGLALPKPGEVVNPFAVRMPPKDAHEIILNLQGLVTGDEPCALVNGRQVSVGDSIEGLQLIRIEPDALLFKWERSTLKLPLDFTTVRVRHL